MLSCFQTALDLGRILKPVENSRPDVSQGTGKVRGSGMSAFSSSTGVCWSAVTETWEELAAPAEQDKHDQGDCTELRAFLRQKLPVVKLWSHC